MTSIIFRLSAILRADSEGCWSQPLPAVCKLFSACLSWSETDFLFSAAGGNRRSVLSNIKDFMPAAVVISTELALIKQDVLDIYVEQSESCLP